MTRRCSPLHGLSSSSCGGFRPSAEDFVALQVCAYFRPFLVFSSNLRNFNSNLSKFQNNQKNLQTFERKNQKTPNIYKKNKINATKSQK